MSRLAKIALILPFLAGLFMSIQAIFMPGLLIETLGGLAATGPVGAASLYSDFVAYFVTFTLGVGAALFMGKTDWLWAPISLFGITAIGRIGHGVMNGFAPEGVQLIASEIILIALMFYAWRSARTQS